MGWYHKAVFVGSHEQWGAAKHCKYLYTLLQCIYYICVVQKVLVELYVYKE